MAELTKPPVLAARGGVWFRLGTAEIHCGIEADFRLFAMNRGSWGLMVGRA